MMNDRITTLRLITLLTMTCLSSTAVSEQKELLIENVSNLPIHASESSIARANIVAIIGGKGMKNSSGASKNYLITQKEHFISQGINYYIFPNRSAEEKATYELRASSGRREKIHNLVKEISKRNSLPIYLVGFSRGSVDATHFAKKYPNSIEGIILMSGVYKRGVFSVQKIAQKVLETNVLVVHHKQDNCKVTPYKKANDFTKSLQAKTKKIVTIDGGLSTGRECGPLNHHGFEGVEKEAADAVTNWIINTQ